MHPYPTPGRHAQRLDVTPGEFLLCVCTRPAHYHYHCHCHVYLRFNFTQPSPCVSYVSSIPDLEGLGHAQANRDFGFLLAATLTDLGVCFALPRLNEKNPMKGKVTHGRKDTMARELAAWEQVLGQPDGLVRLQRIPNRDELETVRCGSYRSVYRCALYQRVSARARIFMIAVKQRRVPPPSFPLTRRWSA